MAKPIQFLGESRGALARPPQERLRITACPGLDQPFQNFQQLRIHFGLALAAASCAAHPRTDRSTRILGSHRQLAQSFPNRVRRHPEHGADRTQSTSSARLRFARRPLPPHPLIHHGGKHTILGFYLFERALVLHAHFKSQ
jgi:hypothetical protein